MYDHLTTKESPLVNAFQNYEENIVQVFNSENEMVFATNLKQFKQKYHQDNIKLFLSKTLNLLLEIPINVTPILNYLSKSIQRTKFKLGEIKLEVVSEDLKLVNDYRHFYNADGIILNLQYNLEVAILETTGPLLLQNYHKEAQDYIKAGYGLVSMLHVIGRKFHYGDVEILERIGVFFYPSNTFVLFFFPCKFRSFCFFM